MRPDTYICEHGKIYISLRAKTVLSLGEKNIECQKRGIEYHVFNKYMREREYVPEGGGVGGDREREEVKPCHTCACKLYHSTTCSTAIPVRLLSTLLDIPSTQSDGDHLCHFPNSVGDRRQVHVQWWLGPQEEDLLVHPVIGGIDQLHIEVVNETSEDGPHLGICKAIVRYWSACHSGLQ